MKDYYENDKIQAVYYNIDTVRGYLHSKHLTKKMFIEEYIKLSQAFTVENKIFQ